MSLRILFLTCHLPYPPISGGRHREYELLQRIGSEVDVSVCAVSKTPEEDRANAPALGAYCSDVQVVAAEPARSTESPAPFQVLRHRARHVPAELVDGDFDVIHVEGFYLMQHVAALAPRPTVLVEQNIEYQLWEQRAAHATGSAAWRLRREAERTKRAERAAWHRADVVAALTEEDRAVIRAAGLPTVHLVPDGISRTRRAASSPSPPNASTITFVANFGYEPNVDAAVHFARAVLPRVTAAVPDAHLMLVGNAPPAEVQGLAGPSITVTGRVPEVSEYLDAATVVVCPLRVGGGVKVKMLDALAHGKAIVSTSVGVQGLGRNVSDAVVVADAAQDMATAVIDLLQDPDRRRRLEAAATHHVAQLPTWEQAAAALLKCYEHATAGRERLDA